MLLHAESKWNLRKNKANVRKKYDSDTKVHAGISILDHNEGTFAGCLNTARSRVYDNSIDIPVSHSVQST